MRSYCRHIDACEVRGNYSGGGSGWGACLFGLNLCPFVGRIGRMQVDVESRRPQPQLGQYTLARCNGTLRPG